jgi:ClpP class serine protease
MGVEKTIGNIWNLFWLFIVFVSVMPIVQQKTMQAKRFGLIRKLEKKRNSRVITLIHRQETTRFPGLSMR